MASSFVIPSDKAGLLAMAKLAEQCERYDEMLVCMKRLVKLSPVLDADEKNLLSVAYKNVIGSRRTPWRTIAALDGRSDKTTSMAELISQFKQRLESEIGEICNDIVSLLEKHLIPAAEDKESQVFYLKMKGDYHRYFVEASPSEQQTQLAQQAYQQGFEAAAALPLASPIRLGLALNYSVFHYEILKQLETGYQMAKKAFYDALEEVQTLSEADYPEAATIMSLLRDNLASWADALGKGEEQDDGTAVEEM
jgi:14-3-3 protein epsilon